MIKKNGKNTLTWSHRDNMQKGIIKAVKKIKKWDM
jgi:hypothetical protein